MHTRLNGVCIAAHGMATVIMHMHGMRTDHHFVGRPHHHQDILIGAIETHSMWTFRHAVRTPDVTIL